MPGRLLPGLAGIVNVSACAALQARDDAQQGAFAAAAGAEERCDAGQFRRLVNAQVEVAQAQTDFYFQTRHQPTLGAARRFRP